MSTVIITYQGRGCFPSCYTLFEQFYIFRYYEENVSNNLEQSSVSRKCFGEENWKIQRIQVEQTGSISRRY